MTRKLREPVVSDGEPLLLSTPGAKAPEHDHSRTLDHAVVSDAVVFSKAKLHWRFFEDNITRHHSLLSRVIQPGALCASAIA